MSNAKSKNNSKASSAIKFILVVALIGLIAYSGAIGFKNIFGFKVMPFSETIKKGLDLQGGISVLEEIQTDDVEGSTMERTIELLSMRINPDGVKEISILQEGDKRIRIEIPGEFDAQKVLESIGKTGLLEFKDPEGNVILTGKDVTDSTAYLGEYNKPTIGLELNEEGSVKFAEATGKFIGQEIGIYMDGELLTNPTVNSKISDGKAIITGSSSLEDATRKASIIKSGALPVTLKAIEYKTVGATLGANALPLSTKAGLFGIAAIFIFMIIYYGVPGLMADIALVLYGVMVLGTFSTIEATLTLAGIAGFLLTVGMAVDANVIIFERIKEELKVGKTIKNAVDSGFHRALSSILDGNITTIIAAIVLYSFGSGSVKGFALTLMIGIVLSVFTALTVTKMLIKLGVEMGLINTETHFGMRNDRNIFKIVEKTKLWFTISLLVITIGIVFTFVNGFNFGIDFNGGTVVTVELGENITTADKTKIDEIISKFDENVTSNTANNTQIEIKSNTIDENAASEIVNALKEEFDLGDDALLSQANVGPSVGKELKSKAVKALIIATLAMLVYIAFRFELQFGLAAIVALLHDVLITLSVYTIFAVPINNPFIAAMLTIVGYSINDTIVIFDRIRENRKKMKGDGIEEITNKSVSQTMSRSINTTLTTLFTIVAVYVMVPVVRDFTFPLMIGVLSGAYSSIFIASPVWVLLKKKK